MHTEKIKIFAAYLPYNVAFSDLTCDMPNKLILDTENFSGVFEDANHLNTIRLHLYDLSFLTKEIEHEGERFVPIVELLKLEFPNQKGRYAETDFSADGHPSAWFKVDAGKTIRVDVSRLNNAPYWMVRKLLSWHLNVFGLPAGDFIDKSTLKTESNDHS